MTEHIAPQDALIWLMVCVSAADGVMTDGELHTIGEIVKTLPVFEGYDPERLPDSARACGAMLHGNGGVDEVLRMIAESVPAALYETAYALACEVAAVDTHYEIFEARILQMIRGALRLDRLAAAAIERGVQARYRVL